MAAWQEEPSEVLISQVCEFAAGLLDPVGDRELIIQALKLKGNDVQAVVGLLWEDPDEFRRKIQNEWAKNSGPLPGFSHETGISFNIEPPNQNDVVQSATPPPNYGIPPSRPPSRTNSRSPLERVGDWALGSQGVPGTPDQEQEDLERAVQESLQAAKKEGIVIPQQEQESGVSNGSQSKPAFGPSTRSDLEGTWAMVPTGPAALGRSEEVPAASTRERAADTPAMLIYGSSSSSCCLGGLLTILHEIPLCRNILLALGNPAASYGHNSAWWNGSEILPPHILSQMQQGQLQQGQSELAKPVFEEELHRLMSFLDSTQRSYGSVEVLAKLLPGDDTVMERHFYEELVDNNKEVMAPIAHKVTVIESKDSEVDPNEITDFFLIEIDHKQDVYDRVTTLYQCIDHVMWSDALTLAKDEQDDQWHKMAMLEQTGEVMPIKLVHNGPSGSFEIPRVFYPERWLVSRKEEAAKIQFLIRKILKSLESSPTSSKDKLHEKISKQIAEWEVYSEFLEGKAQFRTTEESGFNLDKQPIYRLASFSMTDEEKVVHQGVEAEIQRLKKILEDTKDQHDAYEAQVERLRAKLQHLGKMLTEPDKEGRKEPMTCKEYHLRGIACPSDIVYVCRRRKQDLIELDDEPERLDQWWRLEYSPTSSERKVKAEKVEFEQVVQNVWQETKRPVLVYATEAAMSPLPTQLSDALNRFVLADNKAFKNELEQEKTRVAEPQETRLETFSPTKRKHRDSFDSMASNRVSIGSDRNNFDDPFADNLEMVDTQEHVNAQFPPTAHLATPEPELINLDYGDSLGSDLVRSPTLPPRSPPLPARSPPLPARNQGNELRPLPDASTAAMTSNDEVSKAPEMQQRTPLPPFMSKSLKQTGPRDDGEIGGLNMEMSDQG